MEGDEALPKRMKDLEQGGKLVIDRDGNKLTNRFRPRQFVTNAVFSVDDDLVYGCDAMATAFQVWSKNPQRPVGFAPRLIHEDMATKNVGYEWNGAFHKWKADTVFITKGAFVHKDLLTEYFTQQYEDLRHEVDQHITGEDILFSFMYAHNHRMPVVPMVIPSSQLGQYKTVHCAGKSALASTTSSYRPTLLKKMVSVFGSLEPYSTSDFVDAMTGNVVPHNVTNKTQVSLYTTQVSL